VVVFCSTTAAVDYYVQLLGCLTAHGQPALGHAALFCLHGSLPQAQRTSAFAQFKMAPRGVLVTTDVAARGLHFPALDMVR